MGIYLFCRFQQEFGNGGETMDFWICEYPWIRVGWVTTDAAEFSWRVSKRPA